MDETMSMREFIDYHSGYPAGLGIDQQDQCQCVTHDGPHWLHVDWIDHMQCLDFHLSLVRRHPADLWNGQLVLVGFSCLAGMQSRRLQQKRANLLRSGLKAIDYTMLGHGKAEQLEALKQQVHEATNALCQPPCPNKFSDRNYEDMTAEELEEIAVWERENL